MRPDHRTLLARPGLLALLLALVLALGLSLHAHFFHPMEVHSGESDRYVERAEVLLAGRIPQDAHRPLLYPLLTAGLSWLIGDTFLAGKLISTVATGLLLVLAFLLAARLAGERTGLLAVLILAGNGHLLENGMQAATDPLFAALAAFCLWATLRVAEAPSAGRVAVQALGFALAWFTRYPAVALLPSVLLALLLPAPTGPREWPGRGRRLLVFCGAALCFLVPHFWLTWRVFGSPLHNETWRSIALKHFGRWDERYLGEMPFDGLWSVLTHAPGAMFEHSLQDSLAFLRFGLPALLAGSSAPDAGGRILLVLLALGTLIALWRRPRQAAPVLLFAAVYAAMVCAAFAPHTRLMLAILPGCAACIALAMGTLLRLRAPRLAAWRAALAVLLVLWLVGRHVPGRLRAFDRMHPREEVRTALELARAQGPGMVLLSSYVSMNRVGPFQSLYIETVGEDLRETADAYFERIRRTIAKKCGHFVLLGRVSLGDTMFERVRRAPLPDFLDRLRDDGEVLLLAVTAGNPHWVEAAGAAPNPYQGGTLRFTVRLLEDAAETVTQVHLRAIPPSGEHVFLTLARQERRVFTHELTPVGLQEGAWQIVPIVTDAAGRTDTRGAFVLEVR